MWARVSQSASVLVSFLQEGFAVVLELDKGRYPIADALSHRRTSHHLLRQHRFVVENIAVKNLKQVNKF